MSLPTGVDVVTLDWSSGGKPFCRIAAKNDIDLSTIDWSQDGKPFAGASSLTPAVNGTLNQTLGALTLVATATVLITASLNQTLGALTATGTGSAPIDSDEDQTLGALTVASAAQVLIDADLSITLGMLTLDSALELEGAVVTPTPTPDGGTTRVRGRRSTVHEVFRSRVSYGTLHAVEESDTASLMIGVDNLVELRRRRARLVALL
jgi:hypothetical protein